MLTTLLGLFLGFIAQAPPSRSEATVRTLPTFAAVATSANQTEVTVRWVVTAPPPPPATAGALVVPGAVTETNQFEILKRRAIAEAPVRERDPRIGADDLVIVAVDDQDREVAWQRMKDPRIVRSEQPGVGGLLSGQVLYRPETELVIRLPEGVNAARVRVYGVEWDGGAFLLRGLGTIRLSR